MSYPYKPFTVFSLLFVIISFSCSAPSGSEISKTRRSSIIFGSESVQSIQNGYQDVPLFNQTLKEAIREVDAQIESGIDVPIPKDLAGGYTHTRHKLNYHTMQKAGKLFVITGNEKYAVYIKDMLKKYADMFPGLGRHPSKKSYSRGKLFWQCLNDANWLVYASQAYDCVYDWMSEEDKTYVETNLFKPYADFLSIENPQFFNRIHNHSTWANAGVGMIGLVMKDTKLVDRALYGLEIDSLGNGALDNDGGSIMAPGQTRAGFLAQMDLLFSPDGFYAEGPYYQRYAIYPFVVFAASLQNAKPDVKIFEYRDGILNKAVFALLNLTDSKGDFYPINDAQKGMSYYSRELVSAADIIYHFGDKNPQLLSIIKKQDIVLLDPSGFSAAKAIAEGKSEDFEPKSMALSDGANGDEGGLGILRSESNDADINAILKYTGQGMGHGHYDKLSFALYEDGDEVLQDYGVARFVNIKQKDGGGYLKENKTFAKQTIAHNTLVVNQTTNYKGKIKIANQNHSEYFFHDFKNPAIQVVSAKDSNAYEGVVMHRTICLISDDIFEKPLLVDLFQVESDEENTYDLPYYYLGQIISTNVISEIENPIKPLGQKKGYQHLNVEAKGKPSGSYSQLTWMNNYKFYTLTTLTETSDQIYFGRIGANDPNFNLRRDPMYMTRRKAKSTVFASVIEPHGEYSPVTELSTQAFPQVEAIDLTYQTDEYVCITIKHVEGATINLVISRQDAASDTKHNLEVEGEKLTWTGPYHYKINKQ